MDWDQQMWSTSTDGLTMVSQAITTGKLDMAAYNELAMRLRHAACRTLVSAR